MIFFIDVQGTLIDDKDKKPIVGAVEFINSLNKNRTPYIVITNNTKYHSKDFLNYLNSLGFDIQKKNYIDPLMVLKDLIKTEKIAPFGTKNFLEIIENLGYILDYKNPQNILISVKEDYNNSDFAQMIELLLQGAKLYGMHATSMYVKNNKRYPGVGAILSMLSYAVGVDYEVVGKPSLNFYKKAAKKIEDLIKKEVSFKDITIISDDAKGDLLGAKRAGMKTILVLSGKIKDKKELSFFKKDDMPDMVFKNIKEIGRYLGVLWNLRSWEKR